MLTIAVFPNRGKKESQSVLQRVIKFFAAKDVRLLLPAEEAVFFGYPALGVDNFAEQAVDIGLSIGGDGTLLGVCRRLYDRNIPVCGINIGTFGFLADIELAELEEKLCKILRGEYSIEKRLILACQIKREGKEIFLGHAVNDAVITTNGPARMIRLGIQLSGYRVSDYKADGLIIATPTGSTAYSLSAGGPIVHPEVKALIVTPICPHTFNVRPMVVDHSEKVQVDFLNEKQEMLLTLDGQKSVKLTPDDEVIIQQGGHPVKIVKFADKNYYQTVRTKFLGE